MALTDKNIVITPNVGQSDDPKIVFSGADASTAAQNITLRAYPTNSGTLSFEGSAGQLFSITNSLTGTIFSVNDISGIPSVEVLDSGIIKLAQYSGNVLIGTATDSGSKLQVTGDIASTSVTTSGNITVGGNLTVNGTTITVNTTTLTVDDPVITLGGDTAPTADDNKDRGVEFRWHTGSAAKVGFFGFDDSSGKFTFIPDATNSSEVFSGTAGTIVATTFEGNLTGNVTGALSGNATTASNLVNGGGISAATGSRYISIDSTDGWAYLSLKKNGSVIWDIAQQNGGNLEFRPAGSSTNAVTITSAGVLTANTFSGALSGNATTATTLANSRTIWGQNFNGSAAVSGSLSSVGPSITFTNTAANDISTSASANGTVGRALTIGAGSTTAGTSNIVGGNLIIQSGAGTGTGASSILFNTGTTLTSGTTLQTISTKMTILGSGNVGIGPTAPAEKLHIEGDFRIDDASGNDGFKMVYDNTAKSLQFNYVGA